MLVLIFPLIGLVIYLTKPNLLFIFWMVIVPLLCPVFCLLGGFNTPETAREFIYMINGNMAYLYIILILMLYGKKSWKLKSVRKIFISLGVLCAFFVFHMVVTYFSGLSLYINIKSAVYLVLPMLVMVLDENTRPKLKHLYITVVAMLILQTVFVYLNYMGVRTYISWYEYAMTYPEFVNLATGTFISSADLGDNTATILLFLTLDFFGRGKISKMQFLCILMACGVCLMAAGSRMPIALSAIIFVVIVFVYERKHMLSLLTVITVAFAGLYWLGNYKGGNLTDNDGVNRIVNGMTSFVQAKKDKSEDNSTVRLSEKLIDGYFWQSPLLGNGRANVFEDAYPVPGDLDSNRNFVSDARLAFMLVEYGILGLFLYLNVYLNIFRYFRKRMPPSLNQAPYIAFFFYLIFSVTEGGLWDSYVFPYVYIYFFGVMREYGVEENKNNQLKAVSVTTKSI